MTAAIIVAAGEGSRFGGRKQFTDLCGRPLLQWSVDLFDSVPEIAATVIVAPPGQVSELQELARTSSKVIAVVAGGESRTGSVRNGLAAVPLDANVILVHDAARPLASAALVRRTIEALESFDGVVPGVPVTDTIKVVEGDLVKATVDRDTLRAVQTPQGFRASVIRLTHGSGAEVNSAATDDAAILEQAGYKVGIVEGEAGNIKITYPQDLETARTLAGLKGASNCV